MTTVHGSNIQDRQMLNSQVPSASGMGTHNLDKCDFGESQSQAYGPGS